jgi:hypothetical protein
MDISHSSKKFEMLLGNGELRLLDYRFGLAKLIPCGGVCIGVTDYKSTALLGFAYYLDCYKTYSCQSMFQSKKGSFP